MATDLNGKSFKAFIKYAFEKAKRRYSVSDENLYNNGTVYYMNGNDGTDFDWNVNDMLCEFCIFHKESEMGYIKLSVKRDGKYWVYIYEDGAYKPIMSYEGNVSEYLVLVLDMK